MPTANIKKTRKVLVRSDSRGAWTFAIPVLAAFFSLFTIAGARGASYYVDFSNSQGSSSDANAGTSANSALVHCPGDVNYSGPVALQSGDIVIFKRGITYSGKIRTVSPGVTYTVANWGTGDAIIDGGANDSVFQVGHSSITIYGGATQNLRLTGAAIADAAIWNYASNPLSGSKFTNLQITSVGNSFES